MKNWFDKKISDGREKPYYRVNVLDKKMKEVWKYFRSLNAARKARQKAIGKALDSHIAQKINGKYQSI